MSALSEAPVISPIQTAEPKPVTLRAVPYRQRSIASLPFALIVVFLLGSGMAGVVMLSTSIQAQSEELHALQRTEAELRYQEAALSARVQDMRSSQQLASKAWELGMRPDPNPAFIQMPSGRIIGDPQPVRGDEIRMITPIEPAETSQR